MILRNISEVTVTLLLSPRRFFKDEPSLFSSRPDTSSKSNSNDDYSDGDNNNDNNDDDNNNDDHDNT